MTLDEALAATPIIAILRGLRSDEAVDIVEALYEAGVRAVEVPLNSPQPLTSIASIAAKFGSKMLVGAGTALTVDDVSAVAGSGGRLIVSPNVDPDVIAATVRQGLTSAPGFATATEAFSALAYGAHALKLFPASSYGVGHISALSAVLPKNVPVLAVGGVDATNISAWRQAGAHGFGLGSVLFKPGMTAQAVHAAACECVRALRRP